ncbi:MAG: protoporphyrinogen oxidase [Anaerolineae bacterium]
MKKRVLILGAGISGLSAAHHLLKVAPHFEIYLLEQSKQCGGWIQTNDTLQFLFEKGPRTFNVSRCPDLLQLAYDLDLHDQIISSSKEAKGHYVLLKKKLQKLPKDPFSLLISSLTRPLFWALLKEWRVAPSKEKDESIFDFISRRLSKKVATQLFDPLVQGIYAGEIKELSISACFPLLKNWEQRYGSLTRGFLNTFKKRRQAAHAQKLSFSLPSSSLFSFKGGVQTLTNALKEELKDVLYFENPAKKIDLAENKVKVFTEQGELEGDILISALPSYQLAPLIKTFDVDLAERLSSISWHDLVVVNLGYLEEVLPIKGYGYLVPTSECEDVAGVVFDSLIFPQQNQHVHEERLTVMIRGRSFNDEEALTIALRACQEHLMIEKPPAAHLVTRARKALPQYTLGHADRIAAIDRRIAEHCPHLFLVGNYLYGTSVNDCISLAKKTIDRLLI